MAADNTYNLAQAGTLNPEQFAQQQQLNRQQQMAQMLMQQSGPPQGQMISGRYVAPSWAQQLVPLANIMASKYIGEKADTEATKLARAIREQEMSDINKYNEILKGKEAVPGQEAVIPQGQTLRDDQGVLTMGAQEARPGQAAVPGDVEKANLFAASSYSPILRQMGVKRMTEGPKWEKSERIVNGVKETGYVDLNSPNPPATFRMAGSSPDIDTAKAVYEGYLPGTPQAGGNVPVSVRNNNPGNLVGSNGQFLTFATPQQGDAALVNDLTLKISGQSPAFKARFGNAPVTPATLAETWSPAAAKGNSAESTTNYGKAIATALGIAPNAPIPNTPEAIQKVKAAITQFEAGAYGGQNPQQDKYAPTNLPQYQDDPTISPKENMAARAAFNKENQVAIKNAKNSFDVLKNATEILSTNAPSSGRGENIVTGTREFFGGGGEASKADAQLKIYGSKLTMQVPRFEGPQSDKDTALYQAAAGDVGNPNIPIASRLASIETMKEIAKKYYPNGDWDSIDTGGAVVKKNILGGVRGLGAETMTPQQFAQGLNPQDREAFNWARKNPNDPRATQIIKKLGID